MHWYCYELYLTIGAISNIMPRDEFVSQLNTLVTKLIQLYKKEKLPSHVYITKSLFSVFNVAVQRCPDELAPTLTKVLDSLYPYVIKPVDSSISTSITNHNELLRCYEILLAGYTDEVLEFIFKKMENKNAGIRNGAVDALRHCINRKCIFGYLINFSWGFPRWT